MKTVGKYLENEELEKVLKKTEGLGTLFIKMSVHKHKLNISRGTFIMQVLRGIGQCVQN